MAQGFTKGAAIDTDGTLSANSDFLIPSQKAVKTYADTKNPLATGTPDGTKYLRDDNSWQAVPASTDTRLVKVLSGAVSPADSFSYVWGDSIRTPGGVGVALYFSIYFREAGTITAGVISWESGGAAGTGENISMYVRLNNTTDYLISTVGNTTAYKEFSNTAMSIPIVSGDFICMKLVTPPWATNPTAVYLSGNLTFTLS